MHHRGQFLDPGFDAAALPSLELRNRPDVLGHGSVGHEADRLDHVADPAAKTNGVLVHHVSAVDLDGAGGGLDEPVDHAEGGGLAAPGWAHQGNRLASLDVE